ncbi:bleomycin resistance protein [Kribbella sandramycini]|uniref:Bleomycin resistance protein n=1 Tax=Kribbella sandramycini TaxID=60450 RepID=A0A7Y4NXU2_9ACTN|nr:VOC family protein [Kribbella sandramycini]MBB6567565.1 putative glyoxalase superfamily protein PhnB [Kribbella sandramycini]NOL39831.1 bleomycin resistance protein [Kribbella sandramycini]
MKADDIFPIVTTGDLPRLLEFYGAGLGGEEYYRIPAEGAAAYVALRFGTASLGLAAGEATGAAAIALWVYVDDCDAAVERARAVGAEVVEGPATQAWGERIARVLDPDGNQVVLGQRAP